VDGEVKDYLAVNFYKVKFIVFLIIGEKKEKNFNNNT
jgi:hypothetical protein